MRRLLQVELTRLRWRRAILLLLVLAVAVPAVIFGVTAWDTRPISDADRADAQAQVERDMADPSMGYSRELQRCLDKPRRYGVGANQDVDRLCEQRTQPQVEWYLHRDTLRLNEQRRTSLLVVVALLTVIMLLIGTTFAGHDWASGSMSNQLLFESRRSRIWVAKGLAVLLVGLVASAVVLTAFWTGFWLLAEQRDLEPLSRVVRDGFGTAGRGALFAACAGLGGYAATMLFRSTVATLGVLFAVSIIAPLLIAVIAFSGYPLFMPQNNFAAIVKDGVRIQVYDDSCQQDPPSRDQGYEPCVYDISALDGTLYYGVMLLAAGGLSLVAFRRRDVP